MPKSAKIGHKFVEFIPDDKDLEEGIIYVSTKYETATHKCFCGCRTSVVTPLSPVDWVLTYDGSVSLWPSIGSWSIPCQSHYWIKRDLVIWSSKLNRREITSSRKADNRAARHYYNLSRSENLCDSASGKLPSNNPQKVKHQKWKSLARRLKFGRKRKNDE